MHYYKNICINNFYKNNHFTRVMLSYSFLKPINFGGGGSSEIWIKLNLCSIDSIYEEFRGGGAGGGEPLFLLKLETEGCSSIWSLAWKFSELVGFDADGGGGGGGAAGRLTGSTFEEAS